MHQSSVRSSRIISFNRRQVKGHPVSQFRLQVEWEWMRRRRWETPERTGREMALGPGCYASSFFLVNGNLGLLKGVDGVDGWYRGGGDDE